MRVIDLTLAEKEDVCLSRIVLMSGIRPARRSVDNTQKGRAKHGFLYIWEGEVEFTMVDGTVVRSGSGDLTVIPKGCCYSMRYVAESTTFVLMNYDLTVAGGEEVSLSRRVAVLANDGSDRRIAGIMAKLEMCSASENSAAVFRRKELAYRLLSVVFDDTAMQNLSQARRPGIVPGVLLLQQSYLENIPIERFAQACDMSESSFRRQFSAAYGQSPVQYRNRLRVRRARSLLADGNCTVSEAAYASGFENLGYFTRCYRKFTGENPRETRTSEQ